jgi:hypothetical protein
MNRQGEFWLGLPLGLLLLVCPCTIFSQNTGCTAEDVRATLPSDTAVYRDAIRLSEALRKKGILMKCILASTMEGTFEGQSGAALYRSDHGSFEVLFLPQSRTFDQLKIIEQHNGDRYSYRFKGPPQPWPANLIDSAFRIDFVKDRNLLFVVQNDAELSARLQEFAHSDRLAQTDVKSPRHSEPRGEPALGDRSMHYERAARVWNARARRKF